MATVIDALLVQLGFDASGVKKGARETKTAQDDITKGFEKTGRASEDASKRSTKTIKEQAELRRKSSTEQTKQFKAADEETRKLTAGLTAMKGELVGLLAAFTGDLTLKDFISDTITGTAALGRLATNLGITAQQLSAIQGAAIGPGGGSARDANAGLQALAALAFQIQTTGTAGDLTSYMQRMGLDMHSFDDPSTRLSNLAAGLERLKAQGYDRNDLVQVAGKFGQPGGMVNALLLGKDALNAYIASQEKQNPITKEQIKAAKDAQTAWSNLGRQWDNVGLQITTALLPAIQTLASVLKSIADWAQANPKTATAIFTALAAGVIVLSTALTLLGLSALFAMAALDPIVWIIAAVVAGVGALLALNPDAAKDLGDAIGGLATAIGQLFSAIQQLLSFIPASVWKTIGDSLRANLVAPFKELADQIRIITDDVRILIDLMHGDLASAGRDFAQLAKDQVRGLRDLLPPVPGRGAAVHSVATGVGQAVGAVVNSPAAHSIGNAAKSIFDGFGNSIGFVLSREGGLTRDTGGLTKFGISQKAYPNLDIANLTRQDAIDIYRRDFWNKLNIGSLAANMQTQVLDAAVNEGVGKAREFLQASGGDPQKFLALREQHYRSLAARNPAKYGKYLKGWLARAETANSGPPTALAGLTIGAAAAPAAAANNNSRTTNADIDTNIGTITINAPGADSNEIGRGIQNAITRHSFVPQVATGLV